MSELIKGFPDISNPVASPLSVGWRSPSNIAIIKYWGKKGRQLPVNPSVSMTLSEAYTETRITASEKTGREEIELEFYFMHTLQPAFGERIAEFLKENLDIFPFLRHVHLKIESFNTFPHSSGIASSASAFSALALCLSDLGEKITGLPLSDFNRFASHVARLGSGSACRSIYPGFTLWGELEGRRDSDDGYAIPLDDLHPDFQGMRDAILIVSEGEKKVSSSKGHGRMSSHPFAQARIHQAKKNAGELLDILRNGDTASFFRIAETEAMTLHALMMTSDPGFILMEPETIRVINRIQEAREKEGLPVCFTLDAGPNVHLLYFEKDREQVRNLIVEDLIKKDKQNAWIDDKLGKGPERVIE